MLKKTHTQKSIQSYCEFKPKNEVKVQFLDGTDKKTLGNISKKSMKLIKESIIHISQKQYKQLQKSVFPYLKSTQSQQFRLILCNLNESIFREISHIKFEKLTLLNLLNNQITNIEGLTFLQAPNLRRIGISTNYIVNATSTLARLQFKNIQVIDLNGNIINQLDLGRLQVNQNQIDLMIRRTDSYRFIIEDISMFAKIKNWERKSIIGYLMYYEQPTIGFTNILQPKCAKALKNKIMSYQTNQEVFN